MKIGYSFWGFLGNGITDTPDGGRSHRRPLIDALLDRGHEIVFLQANRDLLEAGDDLGDGGVVVDHEDPGGTARALFVLVGLLHASSLAPRRRRRRARTVPELRCPRFVRSGCPLCPILVRRVKR